MTGRWVSLTRSLDIRRLSPGGGYAASRGMAFSANRRNRMLRAPATDPHQLMDCRGTPKPAWGRRSVAGAGFKLARTTVRPLPRRPSRIAYPFRKGCELSTIHWLFPPPAFVPRRADIANPSSTRGGESRLYGADSESSASPSAICRRKSASVCLPLAYPALVSIYTRT
jgi:hypothetical protein